jgi:hypothetical protein
MKQEILFIWSFLLLLCLGACQKEAVSSEDVAANEGITLELVTRANDNVEAGDDRFNENLITKADVFFFENENENAACVYSQIGVTPSGNKIKVKLDNFNEGSYYVYVIANGNFTYDNNGVGVTLGTLKSKEAHTEWKNSEGEPEPSLLMDGGNICQVEKNGKGNVALTRAMAKVTLSVTATEIEEDDGTYVPQLSGMYVSMVNIVKRTNLKGDYQVNSSDDYLKMDKRIIRKYQQSETGEYYHVPFYSYPNPENTVNREDAYLILKLPWKKVVGEGGGNYDAVDYYYQVPITGSDALALCSRNHYYKLNLKVGVLGSLNPQDPVEVTPSFIIEDWFTEELTAEMQNYRYLVLDEYNSVMNNVNELRMPYVSSSAIKEVKVTKVVYTDYSQVKFKDVSLTSDSQLADYSVRVDGDELVFSHVLTDNDFVPFTITVKVTNEDGISQEWTITQYPAIYIEGHKADYKLYVAGEYTTTTDGWDKDQWFEYVNYDRYPLGSVQNPASVDGTGTNRNYNNYTIHVTSFDVGDKYQIGDPRTLDYNNLEMSGLNSYRPSREDDNSWWVISPSFKIASSRGKTTDISFKNAQRRCAAYQEDGYGAGRWRVPTRAEIEFIVNLSANGKIPTLFDGEYWCADGAYYSSDDKDFHTSGDSQAVRCVYDVWYWGDKRADKPDVFGWRDTPLN